MTRRTVLAICLLSLSATAGNARQSEAPPNKWRGMLVGERAYFMGSAEQAVGPGARLLGVAPKGRYILSERRKPTEAVSTSDKPSSPTEVTLNLWDTKTRKASVLWRFQESGECQIEYIRMLSWLSSTVGLLEIYEKSKGEDGKPDTKPRLLIIRCGSNSIEEMYQNKFVDTWAAYTHPSQPVTLIYRVSPFGNSAIELVLVQASGQQKAKFIVPGGDSEGWSTDGTRFYLSREDKKVENGKLWSAVDLNFNVTPLAKAPDDIVKQPERFEAATLPLRAVEQNATLTVKTTSEKLPSLWLVGATGTEMRVAAEIDEETSVLLSDLSAVAYQHQGALYVVPLISLPKAAYTELEKTALRMKVISEARQIGEAFMLYAQQHNETYPDVNGNLVQDIGANLKNPDVLKKFHYTHTGPFSLPEIKEPSRCVLGYLSGTGGKVLLYADGHVRWEDN